MVYLQILPINSLMCSKPLSTSIMLVIWNNSLGLGVFYKSRTTRPEMFCKTGVLKNYAKFTGKRLCQSFVQLFLKKDALEQVFSCEFCKTF